MPITTRPQPVEPTEVSQRLSLFDRFAGTASHVVSRAPFFSFCVLLVALLQNSETRADEAAQQKLNAIADGLAGVMQAMVKNDPDLEHDVDKLGAAVGLELRESA